LAAPVIVGQPTHIVVPALLRHSMPLSRHSMPLSRHSRESGNPGAVEGCYSGISLPHPSWIPAFAGMTIPGVVAALG